MLASCEKKEVAPFPVLTSSGGRDCLPEPYKRRKCLPACSRARPYCHGRCVSGGRGCFFHPCASSPYRTSSSETCTQLAFEAEEGECQRACHYSGPEVCQQCLEENLPSQCGELSAAPCWHCSSPILQESARCEIVHQNPLDVVKCIKTKQVIAGCGSCVCSLICYWWPGGPQCRACLEEEQAAELFIDHDKCQQGWILSKEDRRCFKAFSSVQNWTQAEISCGDEGGILAEPTSFSSIFTIIEALNIHGVKGESWIGGQKRGDADEDFQWSVNNSTIDSANWALEYPSPSSSDSCMYQTAFDGFFRNKKCSELNSFVCQKKEYSFSSRLLTSSSTATAPTSSTTPSPATSACDCGIAQRQTRIVGGQETEVNKYPWMVALVHPGEMTPWCGGSIVSSQHVLTAAHCTHGHTASTIQVLVGEHDTSDTLADRHSVSSIAPHPRYNHSTADFDFSILTLAAPLNFSSAAAPVCLPASSASLFTDQVATVAGWGDTSSGGPQSSTLQEVNVTIVSNDDCQTAYGSRINRYVVYTEPCSIFSIQCHVQYQASLLSTFVNVDRDK